VAKLVDLRQHVAGRVTDGRGRAAGRRLLGDPAIEGVVGVGGRVSSGLRRVPSSRQLSRYCRFCSLRTFQGRVVAKPHPHWFAAAQSLVRVH
jgi:hypothetical protein